MFAHLMKWPSKKYEADDWRCGGDGCGIYLIIFCLPTQSSQQLRQNIGLLSSYLLSPQPKQTFPKWTEWKSFDR